MTLRRRCQRPDRGATLAQYALLIALVGAVALAAVRELGARSATTFSGASAAFTSATTQPAAAPPDPLVTAPPSTAGPATTAPTSVAPPTTAPPSTAAATTTAAPTTTATATPPTSTVPAAGGGTWATASTGGSGGHWTSTAAFVVRDSNGVAVAGVPVDLKVRYYEKNDNSTFQWKEVVVSSTTDASGTVTVTRQYKGSNGNGEVIQAQYLVEGVHLPGNLAWDQQRPSVSFARPY